MLEAAKLSADILLTAKTASIKQHQEDIKALGAKRDTLASSLTAKDKELATLREAIGQQLAAKEAELEQLQKEKV